MARLSRHELRKDEFSDQMNAAFDFLREHRQKITLIASVTIIVVGVAVGAMLFMHSQQASAASAFSDALDTYHANVAANLPFKTSKQKYQQALAQFSAVASRYSRYETGRRARYYAALCQRELGNYAEAEKELEALAKGPDTDLASLSNLALAGAYEDSGRNDQAERIFRSLQEHPTLDVPKVQAQVDLADLLAKTKPADAAALYQQIQKENEGTDVAEYASGQLKDLAH